MGVRVPLSTKPNTWEIFTLQTTEEWQKLPLIGNQPLHYYVNSFHMVSRSLNFEKQKSRKFGVEEIKKKKVKVKLVRK